MNEKTCRGCGVTKPIDDFTRKASQPDGRDPNCKDCQRAFRQNATPRASRASRAIVEQHPVVDVPASKGPGTFIPSDELLSTFVAVQRLIRAGVPAPTMVFTGPSGSGKTHAAQDLAERAGIPFTKVDAPSMTDPEAWFGTREVVVENGAPKTIYRPSAFIDAITHPGVLCLDEINRIPDNARMIILGLTDDSREVTNPLTGLPVVRHPGCIIVMTANVGLAFTGTYAVDPALWTRSLTTHFSYLEPVSEIAVLSSRTNIDTDIAALLVRFATESRERAKLDEDFQPISTRELLAAARLVSVGLDLGTAVRQAILNAASTEGGAESARARLDFIWTAIQPAKEG